LTLVQNSRGLLLQMGFLHACRILISPFWEHGSFGVSCKMGQLGTLIAPMPTSLAWARAKTVLTLADGGGTPRPILWRKLDENLAGLSLYCILLIKMKFHKLVVVSFTHGWFRLNKQKLRRKNFCKWLCGFSCVVELTPGFNNLHMELFYLHLVYQSLSPRY
jgi:hypothetical protein